jgi:error-prone DNA polymerase
MLEKINESTVIENVVDNAIKSKVNEVVVVTGFEEDRIKNYRTQLKELGVSPAATLSGLSHGQWVRIAGIVITRQRPGTAKGFFFITLEDETGVSNAIIRPGMFEGQRELLVSAPSLIIEGSLQNLEGVVSVKAERITCWGICRTSTPSHDFH